MEWDWLGLTPSITYHISLEMDGTSLPKCRNNCDPNRDDYKSQSESLIKKI